MRLPGGDRAIIGDEKLIGYVLNRSHPIGGHHALLFETLLGIGPTTVNVLRDALANAAREGDAIPGKQSAYGRKYEVRFQMTGPRGRYTVLSVWIVPDGEPAPRLVTAYIE